MRTFTEKILILFTTGIFCAGLNAQTTIVLQPEGSEGKDAYIDSRLNENNYGNHIDCPAIAWTNGGVPVDARSLLEFDLSVIPNGATINSAGLSLYSYVSPGNGSHSTESGSNACVLNRITTPWDENTVTWESQPTSTDQNEVFLAPSTSTIQDYLDIDVTILVQDMIANPNTSYGFLLKLVTEEFYRSMIFASSDNPDSTLHPKLELTFTEIETDSCITFRPAAEMGKDAYVDSRLNDINYGNHIDYPAIAWTNGGVPVDARGLLDFDLSLIPDDATIDLASLSLYSYESPGNGSHSPESGSNECVLNRITVSWDEGTVNWDNQPTATDENQVFLAESTSTIQDYLNIDVTNMVRDMIADPDNSHGFLLKLVTEEFYRSMIFASSDNPDSTLHPKLEICYSQMVSMSKEINTDADWKIFPNPASDYTTIALGDLNREFVSIEIVNSAGQTFNPIYKKQSTILIDVSNYAKGLYFVKINFEDRILTKKLIIK